MIRNAVLLVLASVVLAGITPAYTSSSLVPNIYNAGFEEGSSGWGWNTMNGCRSWFRVEEKDPHSGKRCMAFVNESPLTPHVYGRLLQGVAVLPGTDYELSVWVRGTDVSDRAGGFHFTDWNSYVLNLPGGTFGWTRVSTRFKTRPGQYSLPLGLNIADVCKELAIDDISLVPVGVPIKGEGIVGNLLAPEKLNGHNAPGYLRVYISSELTGTATLDAAITSGKSKLFSKRERVKPGDNTFEWNWTSGMCPFGKIDVAVAVLDADGKVIASSSQTVEKADSPLFAQIDEVDKRFRTEFMPLYKKCQAAGIPVDYPSVTKITIEQFVPYIREDIQKAHNWRAEYAVKDFNKMLDESVADMKLYLENPNLAPNARRYRTGKVTIDGYSMIGDRVDSKGKRDRGPVFLYGYGHFSQLRRDMSRLPSYGINMIQSAEIGPAQVLTGEDEVSLKIANEVSKAFDEAAKNNVRVDFLVSPHYFPAWAIQKWPHIAKGGGGFLSFIPDEEEAKLVVEKFLRIIVPMLKDKPSLNSFCLTNEPVLIDTARADNTRPMWNAYLIGVHGDIKTLNERYGTSYASFDDVPVPGNGSFDAPEFYDWCSFNNERFAGWHKWMADIIHEMAPDVPIHAKPMSVWLNRGTVAWGCDPELFAGFGQFNGNDCYFMGDPGKGWSVPWHYQNISYDIQRSVAKKPIFNSENHISPDRATHYINPQHYRTALWQGAVHGQSMTTIWAWERCYDPGYDFYGLVMDRPGCARIVGLTSLDLNRFADEIAAIQHTKSPVAILYSIASHAKDNGYDHAVNNAYSAFCFHGFKVDFITEKQLQAGKGKEYKMLVFPESGHVEQATFDTISSLPDSVKLVFFGNPLEKDPYSRPFAKDKVAALREKAFVFDAAPDAQGLYPKLHEELDKLDALPKVQVVDAITDEPVWGLEWLPAEIDGKTVISIVNLRDKQANIKVIVDGKRVRANDLLSPGGFTPVRVVKPATPVLAEVSSE